MEKKLEQSTTFDSLELNLFAELLHTYKVRKAEEYEAITKVKTKTVALKSRLRELEILLDSLDYVDSEIAIDLLRDYLKKNLEEVKQ